MGSSGRRCGVTRCRVDRSMIEAVFDESLRGEGQELPNGLGYFTQFNSQNHFRDKTRNLLLKICERAPDLLDRDYYGGIGDIIGSFWIRPVEDWVPAGKSRRTKLRSLIDHLIVKYPVPEFLYSCFGSRGRESRVFIAISRGAKVVSCFNHGGYFEIPMTRRMCRYFMASPPGTPFMQAVRMAQVRAMGGSGKLARAICGTFLGREEMCDEGFWLTAIRWLCRQEGLDTGKAGPLLDYIRHRAGQARPAAELFMAGPDGRRHGPFSMKGRTLRSLTRDMEEWHRELALEKKLYGVRFSPSGFEEGVWDLRGRSRSEDGRVRWTMDEILCSEALHAEGKAMKHCVYCYAPYISEKHTSIWSLRRDDGRALTVEVENGRRRIVQARGRCNRQPAGSELKVLRLWARENRLRVSLWHL